MRPGLMRMKRLRARHERFCCSFVECANATLAAKQAGYDGRWARNTGYRLLRQPLVIARIIEIQQETAQIHCRDVETLLGKLETIYRRAVDDHNFSAAARAVELQARLSGAVTTPSRPARSKQASEPTADENGESRSDGDSTT